MKSTYSRRQFFTGFGSMLARAVTRALPEEGARQESRAPRLPYLRPPGALSEPEFLEACTRCTDCLEACPPHAIRRLGPEFGGVRETPGIIPEESPCRLCDDLPCIAACTHGALKPVVRSDVDMGLAWIALNKCYKAQGQPCGYCVDYCPLKHQAIDWDADGLPAVNESACTGCGLCVYYCPPSAITIAPRTRLFSRLQ